MDVTSRWRHLLKPTPNGRPFGNNFNYFRIARNPTGAANVIACIGNLVLAENC
jgi:hypothetical protein